MGLDKEVDKSGQSGAGVEVRTDASDERQQQTAVTHTGHAEKPVTTFPEKEE